MEQVSSGVPYRCHSVNFCIPWTLLKGGEGKGNKRRVNGERMEGKRNEGQKVKGERKGRVENSKERGRGGQGSIGREAN